MSFSFRRFRALARKESLRLLREPGNLVIGLLMPLGLLLIFGYGLSLDVENIGVALVRDGSTPYARTLGLRLDASPTFAARTADSFHEADALLRAHETEALLRFERAPATGGWTAQILVNGVDAARARQASGHLERAVRLAAEREVAGIPPLRPEQRLRYNPAQETRLYLVPGVTVLIMTLIGALLTGLLPAREHESGTFESLFASPAGRGEILAAMMAPTFLLGLAGLCLCLLCARFLFAVPLRGSLTVLLLGSCLYLTACLGIGLLIGSVCRNRFLASQVVLISCFVPTIILSGFIFDLHSSPAVLRPLARLLPATWYVELLQALFLVGTPPLLTAKALAGLGFFALLFPCLAYARLGRSLESGAGRRVRPGGTPPAAPPPAPAPGSPAGSPLPETSAGPTGSGGAP